MRKVRVLTAALALAVAILPAASFAARAQTDINGVVTANGSPVKNATVFVSCKDLANNQVTTKTVHTDATGAYLAVFNAKKCPIGSSVTVSATKKKIGSGSNTGSVSSDNTDKLNVGIINVAIPEFGTIAGLLAVVGAGGVFLVTRRRELGQN
jgi:outer membrane receptor protein involved in Fe transport